MSSMNDECVQNCTFLSALSLALQVEHVNLAELNWLLNFAGLVF